MKETIYQQIQKLNKSENVNPVEKSTLHELTELNKSLGTNIELADYVEFEKAFRSMTTTDCLTIFFSLDNKTRNLIINKGNK